MKFLPDYFSKDNKKHIFFGYTVINVTEKMYYLLPMYFILLLKIIQ